MSYIYIYICDLCITEKLEIALANPENLLNKRSEIVSICRHRTKHTAEFFLKVLRIATPTSTPRSGTSARPIEEPGHLYSSSSNVYSGLMIGPRP